MTNGLHHARHAYTELTTSPIVFDPDYLGSTYHRDNVVHVDQTKGRFLSSTSTVGTTPPTLSSIPVVDVFLDVQRMLATVVSKSTSAKKSDEEPIAVDFRSRQLSALYILLQRTKPQGADSVTVQSVQRILDDAYRSAVSSKK